MGKTIKIMRSSIHGFLLSYHSFASIAGLLVFPVSASILISQSQIPASFSQTISSRLYSLFEAAGFPSTSQLFSLLNLKISQTISSYILTLPFTLTFLILAKALVVQTVCKPSSSSFPRLCHSIFLTHIFNSFVILSANASVFSLLFLTFNAVDIIGLSSSSSILVLSAAGLVLYSVVLANAIVICNFAIVVSAMDNCCGFLEACLLIRGRLATALTLALPTNLGLAAVEALFLYRVVKPYHVTIEFNPSILVEGFTIVYMYSLLIVLDIIVSCMFYKSCKLSRRSEDQIELEPEENGAHQV